MRCAIGNNIADIRTSEIYNEVNKLKKLGERCATKRAVYPLLVDPNEVKRSESAAGFEAIAEKVAHIMDTFLSNLILLLAFYYGGS